MVVQGGSRWRSLEVLAPPEVEDLVVVEDVGEAP